MANDKKTEIPAVAPKAVDLETNAKPAAVESKPVDQRDAEIAMLKEKLELAQMELDEKRSPTAARAQEMAELGKAIGSGVALALGVKQPGSKLERPAPVPLAEEHKGTKTYIVGPSKHYRNGRHYRAGELVTVTNERPARDWKLAGSEDLNPTPTRTHAPAPAGRANDRSIG